MLQCHYEYFLEIYWPSVDASGWPSVRFSILSKDELDALSRIINAFLELAESRAKRNIPMTMEDWALRLDAF